MKDKLGAFITHDHIEITGSPQGPLSGLNFAVKDVFDIEGHITGNGNPDWHSTHLPAAKTASSIVKLLNNGANLKGKTISDELAYSLNGENFHYGTPVNPKAPDRIPGGSSSGSVSAVAGNIVDFALGTDCGGSVRLPASYCGVFGFRPSHGEIITDGIIPLAQSFDTIGWFARDAELLKKVGEILLGKHIQTNQIPRKILIAEDAFRLAGNKITEALNSEVKSIASVITDVDKINVCQENLTSWMNDFRIIQGMEAWENNGAWITRTKPNLGPGILERFIKSSQIKQLDVTTAKNHRKNIAQQLNDLLSEDAILCLPTVPNVAPLKNSSKKELDISRERALSLLCISGLAKLPQVSLPLGSLNGLPVGLSLIAQHGADGLLLSFVNSLFKTR